MKKKTRNQNRILVYPILLGMSSSSAAFAGNEHLYPILFPPTQMGQGQAPQQALLPPQHPLALQQQGLQPPAQFVPAQPYQGLQPPAQFAQPLYEAQQQGLQPPAQFVPTQQPDQQYQAQQYQGQQAYQDQQPTAPTLAQQMAQAPVQEQSYTHQNSQQSQYYPQPQQGMTTGPVHIPLQQRLGLTQNPLLTQALMNFETPLAPAPSFQSVAQQDELEPYDSRPQLSHPQQEVRKVHGKSYLKIGGDMDEARISTSEMQIAAAEVVYKKDHNLDIPGYSHTTIDLFRKLAQGKTYLDSATARERMRSEQHGRTLVMGSDAIRRMRALVDESQQLRNDMADLAQSIHHPWWYAISQSVTPNKAIHSEKDFNADIFSNILYQKPAHKRLKVLLKNMDKIPPLTHPEYLRILWAFDKSSQWSAHEVLFPKVFTRLGDFSTQLLVDWSKRIDLEVLNDSLRKARYPHHVFTGTDLINLLEVAVQTPNEQLRSEKPLLALRDQLRKATGNKTWMASDLMHMNVSPQVALLAKVLSQTKSADLPQLGTIEKYTNHILNQSKMHNIEKNPTKPKKASPHTRRIEVKEIDSLINKQLERLNAPHLRNNLIDLDAVSAPPLAQAPSAPESKYFNQLMDLK